jgi:lysophospholipase L1-like esterase
MTPLIHNYSRLAGRTVHWDTTDNKEWYLKNIQDPQLRDRLNDLGFLDTPIDYTYNSHGFRTAEFDQEFDIVCFGCSFTMGTGVHSSDTWPGQLAELTGLRVANLGHAGSSNDTAFRFSEHYLKFLKPKYAIWLQTDRHRVELLDDSVPMSLNILAGDTSNPCANDYFIKTWFTTDENQQLNLKKNTLAFKYLCKTIGIEPIILDRTIILDKGPFPCGTARDLVHPGADTYQEIAQRIKTILVGLDPA